tara:strand:+ start:629 stop:994 length:366 start_codon:yes stop_codon:yes gene_type:complete
MIKRLFNIARSNISHWRHVIKPGELLNDETYSFSDSGEPATKVQSMLSQDPIAQYYANLEIPPSATLEEARAAWKRSLKKYHPDLHSSDPAKREIATELTRGLNEAYRAIEKEFKSKASTI